MENLNERIYVDRRRMKTGLRAKKLINGLPESKGVRLCDTPRNFVGYRVLKNQTLICWAQILGIGGERATDGEIFYQKSNLLHSKKKCILKS